MEQSNSKKLFTLRKLIGLSGIVGLLLSFSVLAANIHLPGVVNIQGQLSIGTTADPNSKAALDVVSTTSGILPPRMTGTQRDAITSPPEGLLLHNTTSHFFNFYNGSSFKQVTTSGDIVNADINSAAAIAYSKLALTGSIVNADISNSAAIAYSKLALTGGIVNADISGSAAIARGKLATGTINQVVTNDGSGNLTSVATLPISQGGTNNGALAVTAGNMYYGDGSKLIGMGVGTAGQVPVSAGSTVAWGTPQGGLIGDREYITNTNFEVNDTGWAAYADAAGTSPVDGTGGSPVSTCARYTSNPITGVGSLLWTKAGSANRQGEGCSSGFTVGQADQSKDLQIEFDYRVEGGGVFTVGTPTTDSDVEIFVYDVTNAALIPVSDKKLYSNSNSVPTHFSAIFRTSATGASYRLIFHTVTTAVANYQLGYDNISIHPYKSLNISPTTDWVDFPTVTSGGTIASPGTNLITATTTAPTLGTTSINKAQWRRVGGDMEVRWDYVSSTGGAAGSGTYVLNLPPGYQIDTGKVAVNSGANVYQNGPALGTYAFADSSTGINGNVTAYSATQLRADGGASGGSTAYFQWSSASNAFGSATQMFSIHAMFPIVGWSASQTAVRADQSNYDWTAYTPAVGAGFGAATGISFFHRREGGSLHVVGSFNVVSQVASAATISLPGTLTIDANRLSITNNTSSNPGSMVGNYENSEAQANTRGVMVTAPGTSTTLVYFGQSEINNTSALTPGLGTQVTAASVVMAVDFLVPITGWTENQSAPMLVGTVFSNTGGQERVERITISGGTTPTITSQSGAWVSSISRTAAGKTTLNFATGMFSAAPTCTWVCVDGPAFPEYINTPTSTSIETLCVNGSDVGTDNARQIICMGPR